MGRRVVVGLALVALALPFLALLSAPPSAGALAAGDALAVRGQYGQALAAYARASSLEPWRPAPLLRSAELQFRLGRFAEAEHSYRQAARMQPRNGSAWRGLGRALAAQGYPGPAAEALLHAAQLIPDADALYEAAGLYLELDDLTAAAATLSRAADLAEAAGERALEREARLRLAFLVEQENPAAGEAQLDRVMAEAAPGDLSRIERAREALRALAPISSPTHRDAALARGALGAGVPSLAATLLRRAVAMAPAYADAHAYLALALLAQGEMAESSLAAERALALQPDHELARYARATTRRVTGQTREAILELKALLAASPNEAGFLLDLGAACADYGDYEAATDYVRRAAELPGADASVLLAAARFHLDRAYLPERALPWAQRADADLGDAESAAAYGWALHLAGRGDEALAALARAVALEPRSAQARYYLGATYEEQGRAPEAVREYARAADLEPLGPFGGRARQSLLSLGERMP